MKKVLLLLITLIPIMSSVANTTIDIFYKDGSKTHYTCRYWSTDMYDWGYFHIGDICILYSSIGVTEEDYDNLIREVKRTHPDAFVYFHERDCMYAGYELDLCLNGQYISSITRSR